MTDPSGTAVPFAANVKSAGLGGTLTMDLLTGGTWTVVLGAESQTSNPGKLSWSFAVRQPKGAIRCVKRIAATRSNASRATSVEPPPRGSAPASIGRSA